MSATRVVAIVNMNGGTAKGLGDDAVRDTLAAAFAENGLTAEIVLAKGGRNIAKEVRKASRRARKDEIDVIAVGGGDGTIRTAVSVLAGTDIRLALLPLGTMNHFAKDLGVPLDLGEAVALIAAFHLQKVDVGEVNDEVFINNSSIGVYPYMVADRERRTAEGAGKWSATALAVLRTIRRFPRRRLLVSSKGREELRRRTPCLFVGNNEYDTNFLSLGRKQLDGGRLYLYVARPRSAGAFLWSAIRAGFGAGLTDFDLIEVEAAKVKSRASRLPVALDGEVLMMATPLKYRVRPGALRVVVPPPK